DGTGRDIGRMFKRQESVLREWKVEDRDMAPSDDDDNDDHQDIELHGVLDVPRDRKEHKLGEDPSNHPYGSEDLIQPSQHSNGEEDGWDSEDHETDPRDFCAICGAMMPTFAMMAHERFHALPD
ncbi:MAG: hypothetical protein M1830_009339, partial [Pleopsidium flavum]